MLPSAVSESNVRMISSRLCSFWPRTTAGHLGEESGRVVLWGEQRVEARDLPACPEELLVLLDDPVDAVTIGAELLRNETASVGRKDAGRAWVPVCPAAHAGRRCRSAGRARRGAPARRDVLHGDSPRAAGPGIAVEPGVEGAQKTVGQQLVEPEFAVHDRIDPGSEAALAAADAPDPEQ